MTTSEELAARVKEDVDRNGDLIRKREDARRAQDRPAAPIRPSSWQRVDWSHKEDERIEAALAGRTCSCGEPSGKISICADCTRKKYDDFNHGGGTGHPEYLRLLNEIRALHLTKSGGYGTGEDPFANFTAVAAASGEPRYLYAVLRSIEKLTRCLSLHSQGRADELGEEFADVASLLLCAEAMRRSDS